MFKECNVVPGSYLLLKKQHNESHKKEKRDICYNLFFQNQKNYIFVKDYNNLEKDFEENELWS